VKEVIADGDLVAHCGLYCGACRRYLKGRCPGCHENAKATWCKVRSCCQEHGWTSCADCEEHADPNDCGLFNNVFARLFGLVFNSDRRACILRIKEVGVAPFAEEMAQKGKQSLPRRKRV